MGVLCRKHIITIQFNLPILQSSDISSLYLRSVGLHAIGRPLMKRFLLMCCVQPLGFFILERLTTSKEWQTQIHKGLKEESEDDERARCRFSVDALYDMVGEDDDEVHESVADEADHEQRAPWNHALEISKLVMRFRNRKNGGVATYLSASLDPHCLDT